MSINRPAHVIFDMDDVLCHYDVGRRLRMLAEYAGVTARDVRAALWDSGFEDLSDSGGFPHYQEYMAQFSKRLSFDLTVDQWLEARRIAMQPNHEVIALAETIGRTSTLTVYTNNGPLVKQHFQFLLPEAAAVIPRIFCSYEFKTKKPDPDAFRRLTAHLNVDPDTCWFIDDKKSNVEGAIIAGLAGHHFRSYGQLLDDARDKGFNV
jgi:glucose-1-phosphatase